MQNMAMRLDAMAAELDQMARYLDVGYREQKWVHRDIRAARAGLDRIAGHFRGELAESVEAERRAAGGSDVPPWAG